jgi:hypothetical protein
LGRAVPEEVRLPLETALLLLARAVELTRPLPLRLAQEEKAR